MATIFLLAATFGLSSLAKLLNPSTSIGSLQAVGVNDGLSLVAVIAVTCAEIYVSVGLVLLKKKSIPIIACKALLLIFTAYLIYLLSLAAPPDCGCYGLVKVFKANKAAAAAGVFRNMLLFGLCVLYERCTRSARKPSTIPV